MLQKSLKSSIEKFESGDLTGIIVIKYFKIRITQKLNLFQTNLIILKRNLII